jgi:uncharacterized protein (TIGR02996 family)
MTEEDALLSAVGAEPDDDTIRLAYADWLDEHGRPERAEFIRVQCERASGRGDRDRRTELLKRSMQLIQRFGRDWYVGDWPEAGGHVVTGYSFDRGFVETVSLADRPLYDADIERIVDTRPLFALVRSFGVSSSRVGDEGLAAIANSPRASRLTRLSLVGNPFTIRGLEALAASPHLRSLSELSIGYWVPPGPWDFQIQGIPPHELVIWAETEVRDLFRRHGKTVAVRT